MVLSLTWSGCIYFYRVLWIIINNFSLVSYLKEKKKHNNMNFYIWKKWMKRHFFELWGPRKLKFNCSIMTEFLPFYSCRISHLSLSGYQNSHYYTTPQHKGFYGFYASLKTTRSFNHNRVAILVQSHRN